MTALKHVSEVNVILAEAEWVRSGSRIRPPPRAWTPPGMSTSDPSKSTSLFRTLT